MANKRIKDLPLVTVPTASDYLAIDGATTRRIAYESLFASAGRIKLTASTNFYVRTDSTGDGNTGLANTAGGAFLTLQGAYDAIYNRYDLAGFIATVNVAAGTYTSGLNILGPPAVGTPSGALNGIRFVGAGATTIISTAGVCILSTFGGSVIIGNMKLTSSGNDLLYASGIGGKISIAGDLEFGAAAGYHIHTNLGGGVVKASAVNLTVSGDAQCLLFSEKNAPMEIGTGTITFVGTRTFSLATVVAKGAYLVMVQTIAMAGTFASVVGQRYIASEGGTVSTQTGSTTYIPGSIGGTSATGYYN